MLKFFTEEVIFMIISTKKLSIDLSFLMDCQRFALLSVAPVYDYVDGKKTATVTAIRYTVANPETFENFEVKVPTTKPIVTQDRIDNVDERLWVSFENAVVKPYRIEFGKALCSVTADSVKLVSSN